MSHVESVTAALTTLPQSRIARHCVCCGSTRLDSSPAILMPFVAHRVFDWAPIVIDDSWGLRSIRHGQAYSICKTLECLDCGHLFLDIRFADDEMARLYEDYRGESYTRLREHYEPGYASRNARLNAGIRHVSAIEDFLRSHLSMPPRILDWGGDTGKNTPFATHNRAFDIFDISNKDVIPGARNVTLPETIGRTYDLVVCSQVLEHIPYPSVLLTQIRQVMTPDTVLYVEVPFEEVVRLHPTGARHHKRHWHEHVNFFTRRSISSLLEQSGFRVVDLQVLEIGSEAASVNVFQAACKLMAPL